MIEVLLNTVTGAAVGGRMSGEAIHVPHLMDVEVAQVLRRYAATKSINTLRAQQALQDYLDMRLIRYSHSIFLPRVWDHRHNLTASDAVYVALSEALDAPLVTCDRALGSTFGHRATVEVF